MVVPSCLGATRRGRWRRVDREGPAGRERGWRRFVEAERAALENRRRGQLAKLLGEALPGERREKLERLAQEDRSRPELGDVVVIDADPHEVSSQEIRYISISMALVAGEVVYSAA